MVAEKIHNKNITSIIGLENFDLSFDLLTKEFTTLLACGVSTHELPGKNAGKVLYKFWKYLF